MNMSTEFDVVVVGAGPGGYVAAIRASQLGLKTAIVERENLGGICLNWGCIPTKALLKSGEIYEQLSHLADYGLSVEKPGFDFPKIVERSRGIAKQMSSGIAFLMKKHKVEVIEGEAKLEKGNPAPKLVIALKAGGSRTVQAKNVILASGARAREIPAIGAVSDGDKIWTYRDALAPKTMPKSLVVIGSGAIGIEFASFYRALGAEVTVVEALDRIMPVEDAEVSKAAQKAFEKRGIAFRIGAKVSKVEKTKDGVSVTVDVGGKIEQLTAEKCIVAVGIAPNSEGLDAVGLNLDRGHAVTDKHCKTNVAGSLRHRRHRRRPLARPQGQPRRHPRRRGHRRLQDPERQLADSGLHLRQPAGRLGRLHRGRRQGGGHRGQGRSLPIPRQRQGRGCRRDRGLREDGVRRQDRRPDRRPHDRPRSDRDDPGLRHRHHPGSHRGRPARHRLRPPDHVGSHARSRSGRLRTSPAHLGLV
jgi:thioredoxin reductase